MTATTRVPLTRERIIATAVALADENGVDDLSMRKLADDLGVGPMALYNHIDNKEDLYEGMVGHVFSSIALPEEGLDWKEATRRIGAATIREFGRHGWVVTLLAQKGNFGPGAITFMNRILGILRGAGFSDENAHHGWQMLASHTIGCAFQQATNPGEKDIAEVQLAMLRMGDQIPHVVALAPLLAACDFDTEYRFGLEIILDGLESRLG